MTIYSKGRLFENLLRLAPIIILFISVLNQIDLNYIKFFSFNFPFILIYYWSLKKSETLGYGYIFLAGLINDVVVGFPMGFSCLSYLLICGFASYLKNIRVGPKLIQDWLFFLFTILVVNSLTYMSLIIFFSIDLNYFELFKNIFFTFLFYIPIANLFSFYHRIVFREKNDQ